MSREKQIEEMAMVIARRSTAFRNPNVAFMTTATKTAESLYNAGYRKQSEGEWYVNYMMSKTPSKRGRTIHYETYTCSVCVKGNGRKRPNFCPNCGAKMKGGAE